MHKKTFVVELGTDSPNNIDAAEVHLALVKYFVAHVRIDVKEAAQQSKKPNTGAGSDFQYMLSQQIREK